jgi:hypothetical protein
MPEDYVITPLSNEPLSYLTPYSVSPKIESGESADRILKLRDRILKFRGSNQEISLITHGKSMDRVRKVNGWYQESDYPNKTYFIFHPFMKHSETFLIPEHEDFSI